MAQCRPRICWEGACAAVCSRFKLRQRRPLASSLQAFVDSELMALHEQKRSLDTALAENAAELKRVRRNAQAHEKAASRAWQLPPPLRRAALIAYALAGYRVEPAAKLLAANGRKRHWPDKTQGELFALVEALFLEVDEAELAGLADTEHPEDGDAMRIALPYVEEWRLFLWASGLNQDKGVAPSTEAVLQQLETQRLSLPGAVRPAARGTVADARARVWAAAFRKRWGGRHGRLKCREHIPTGEMLTKAGEGTGV